MSNYKLIWKQIDRRNIYLLHNLPNYLLYSNAININIETRTKRHCYMYVDATVLFMINDKRETCNTRKVTSVTRFAMIKSINVCSRFDKFVYCDNVLPSFLRNLRLWSSYQANTKNDVKIFNVLSDKRFELFPVGIHIKKCNLSIYAYNSIETREYLNARRLNVIFSSFTVPILFEFKFSTSIIASESDYDTGSCSLKTIRPSPRWSGNVSVSKAADMPFLLWRIKKSISLSLSVSVPLSSLLFSLSSL